VDPSFVIILYGFWSPLKSERLFNTGR